jgi:hypothetical protein
MLHLYLYLHPNEDLRSKCTIDMSKVSSDCLADECEKVLQHHKECILFLGFLEPGWMLDPKHEARIRRIIRKFETHMIAIHPESIPHAWKNEIDIVYVRPLKNGAPKTINDGCTLHDESETEN